MSGCLIGSLAIKVSDTKTANRSFLFAPDGRIAARYNKIHLFDVDLASGESLSRVQHGGRRRRSGGGRHGIGARSA